MNMRTLFKAVFLIEKFGEFFFLPTFNRFLKFRKEIILLKCARFNDYLDPK